MIHHPYWLDQPAHPGSVAFSDLLQLELLWAHPVKRDEPAKVAVANKGLFRDPLLNI